MSNIMITEDFTRKVFNNELESCFNEQSKYHDNKIWYYNPDKQKCVTINQQYQLFISAKITCEEELDFYDNEYGCYRFTLYDKAVYNALCSLWEDDEDCFTLEQLYRRLTGNSNIQISNYKSPIVDRLRFSLDNIQKRRLRINLYEEMNDSKRLNTKNLELVRGGEKDIYIKGDLISLGNPKTTDGRTKLVYQIKEAPILYQYAKSKHQLDTVSKKHLNIPLSATEETIILRTFLLDRILLIKSKTKKDGSLKKDFKNLNSLPFSSIYEIMGIPKRDKTEKVRKRKQYIIKKTKQILDYWLTDTKLLTSWKEVDDGDGVMSFKIFPNIENLN